MPYDDAIQRILHGELDSRTVRAAVTDLRALGEDLAILRLRLHDVIATLDPAYVPPPPVTRVTRTQAVYDALLHSGPLPRAQLDEILIRGGFKARGDVKESIKAILTSLRKRGRATHTTSPDGVVLWSACPGRAG